MEAQQNESPRTGAPGPFPPPAGPSWKLQRSGDGVLGGVASGLAAASGVDVTLVRLAFVAAGLAGFGVLLYLVLWLVVPKAPAGVALPAAPSDTAKLLRIGMLVAAVVGLLGVLGGPFGWFGWGDRDGGFLLGVTLIAIGGVVLWSRRRDDRVMVAATGTTFPPPVGPVAAPSGGTPPPFTPPTPPSPTPPSPVPSATPSAGLVVARVFGALALVGALVVGGLVITAVSIGALPMRLPALVLTVAIAAFLTLLVATVASKSASAILAGLALMAGAGVLSVSLVDWGEGVGERITTPATVGEVRDHYELAMGRRVLDLSQLAMPETTPVAIDIDHRIGQVDVVLPEGAALEADVEVSIGEVRVLGRHESGVDADLRVLDTPEAARGTVQLDIEVGIGQVRVCRAGPANGGERGCAIGS